MLFEDIVDRIMEKIIRTYSELSRLKTFGERFEYLKLNGKVGIDTFGFDRYMNQVFYKSREWMDIRKKVIIRDKGCDLGIEGYEVYGKILIHHMNPISLKDILERNEILLDPEYLITTVLSTHNAIHYGSENILPAVVQERRKNDTSPWKH